MIKISTIYNTLLYSICLFAICLITPIFAEQPTAPKLVQQFTIEDGLAINGVNALCRDRKGYLWIGTYEGLNRYNGNQITTYNSESDPLTFDNNRVRAIEEAPDGKIWIGTDNGLIVFDYSSNQFIPLAIDNIEDDGNGCIIRKIFVSGDKSEMVCITEMDGILRYDLNLNFKRQHKLLLGKACEDAIQLDGDKYLLATHGGVEYHNISSGVSNQILAKKIRFATTLIKITHNKIIVALGSGLQCVNMTKIDGEYSFKPLGSILYPKTSYKALALDELNQLWLGSKFDGIKIVNVEDLGDIDNNIPHFANNERISTMLFEQNGVKWVATFDNGVYQYNDNPTLFKSINYTSKVIKNKIVQVVPYSDNRVLIRYMNNELAIYNIRNEHFEPLPFQLTEDENRDILRLTYDKRGHLWIVVGGDNQTKLINVDCANGEVKRLHSDKLPTNILSSNITIATDQDHNLWLATIDDILKISITEDFEIEKIETLKDNPFFESASIHRTRVIYSDSYNNQIWIGGVSDGLYNLSFPDSDELKTATVKHYTFDKSDPQSLSSNSISSILRSPDGVLWIGTEQGGICRAKESDGGLVFRRFTQKDGLSNSVVKGIVSDHNGELWIPTNIGLNHFSPRTGRFTIYLKGDGLPISNFNYNCIKMRDGRLLFSGGNNIVHFNSVNLPNKEGKPNMWFSSLHINGDKINTGELFNDRILLDKALAGGDVVKLKYDENVIAVGVDVMCRTKSDNYKIRYKLEPLSKHWTTLPASSNVIRFDGLQPDTYTLSVGCCNFYGAWSETKHITFSIAPPIWKTTWAYVIYCVVFLILLSLGIYTLLHILSLRHKLHIEHITRRNLETLNQEKQRYFSNISHELKTPLTLILAPIAILTDKFKLDVNVTKSLQVINRQSKKMLQLIELAHNVQLESDNLLTTKLTMFDFNRFIGELTQDFKYYAESDDKTLNIIKMEEDVIVEADKSLIEKIVNNLLSNAFKHTRQHDKIRLRYSVDGGMLTLIVEDSGYGIDKKDLPHIFERFYQAKKRGAANIGGTGIGLTFSHTIAKLHGGDITVDSVFGEGTQFTVTLPIVVDTSEFNYIEEHSDQIATHEDMESAMILGDMNIEDIKVREDLRSSLVYLVEDNSDMRDFLEGIISQFYNVKTFSNGAECMEALNERWCDIVVSDVMMPQMDGYELCSAIKSNTMTSHIPVILLTACSTIDEKIKGLSCGADSYIPKPFYPKHTITRIDALLYNRKMLRDRFLVDEAIIKGPSRGNRDNEFMNRLYKLFSDNLSNDEIDIDEIASEMGVSRTLFFQKIKALTNDSPYELLKNYRLKRAAEYLAIGDVQVAEVSFLTGFKSRTHFSKLFKEKYGHTPGKYAKLAKDGDL